MAIISICTPNYCVRPETFGTTLVFVVVDGSPNDLQTSMSLRLNDDERSRSRCRRRDK